MNNIAKIFLSASIEWIIFFHEPRFLKRLSVQYAELYGKLVIYLRQIQSKEVGLEFGSRHCKIMLSL